MELLDFSLRVATIALLATIATIMMLTRISLEARLSVLAVAVTETAYLLSTTAMMLTLPPVLMNNLALLASLTPTAMTWLIVTIFLDGPARKWPWMVASVIVSAAFFLHFALPGAGIVCAAIAVPFYIGLVVLSLWSARDDLVQCRCTARPVFAAAIAGLALFITGAQAIGATELTNPNPILASIQSAGALALSFAFAIWLFRLDESPWPKAAEPGPQPQRPDPHPDADTALIARVGTAMADGIWREEGLTIGALAVTLSVPEHRLRRAINQGLGHRNFSSFINAARIEEARRVLSDPSQSATTVLEIAYSVGFASLGPFNRAFRAETGLSPTEFRKEHELRPADSENPAPISQNLH